MKLVSSTAPGGIPAIRIMAQEEQTLLLISEDEISMIGNLTMGPVKFTANNIVNSSVLRLEGSIEDKVILRGIKNGTSDDSAATVGQVNAVNEIANEAETIAKNANTIAGAAQNDLRLLKPRVTALENNVTFGAITLNDTNVSATQSSTQGGANLTINAASLKFQQVYGDLYMLSGYINLTAASQNLIQMTIDLKPTVNKEFSSIFTTVTGDSGLSQQHGNGYVNSYTVVDDDNGNHTKIRLPYLPSATGAKTIGISIMAKLTNI